MDRSNSKNRIWELDFFRGAALFIMIYWHILYDLKDIYGFNVDYSTGINYYLGKISVILFMLISGISSFLSRNNIKRGLKVLAIAIVITIATHLYDENLGIKFGILHYMGISMLLSQFFQKLNHYVIVILGIIIIITGNTFAKITMSHDYLFVFNLTSNMFMSSDYYPLFPWLGVFLFGIAIGKVYYKGKKSVFNFTIKDNIISKAGRNTLIVYILHQPTIIAVLEIINRYF